MKQILYIIPNRFWGGGQQYIYELSQQIQETQKGKLFYIGRDFPLNQEKYSEFGPYLTLPLKSVIDFYSIWKIGYFLRKNKIDIVHAHIPKDAILAVLAKQLFRLKCKIIMTRHLVRPGKFNILYKWAYKHIDKYIFVSKTAEQGFFQSAPGTVKINNCVIHNGVRGTRRNTESIDLRKKYNLDDSVAIIGFAGRLAQDKGPGILIKAFEQYMPSNAVLILAGDIEKNYAQELSELLSQCKITNKIFFHPYIENIYDFIRQTDIMVIPSIVKESCPLIILETMQQGKAMISTNNGAQVELVSDKQEALLVPPADPAALGKAIQQLIAHPEQRISLGEKALQRSKQFSYEVFFQKMCEIYGI